MGRKSQPLADEIPVVLPSVSKDTVDKMKPVTILKMDTAIAAAAALVESVPDVTPGTSDEFEFINGVKNPKWKSKI